MGTLWDGGRRADAEQDAEERSVKIGAESMQFAAERKRESVEDEAQRREIAGGCRAGNVDPLREIQYSHSPLIEVQGGHRSHHRLSVHRLPRELHTSP